MPNAQEPSDWREIGELEVRGSNDQTVSSHRRLTSAFYGSLILLGLAAFPCLWVLKVPIRYAWSSFLAFYWIKLVHESIFFAAVLYVLASPREVKSMWDRWRQHKPKLLIGIVFLAEAIWIMGWLATLVVFVEVVSILQVLRWARSRALPVSGLLFSVLWPAVWMFLGLLVVSSYNNVIATVRFYGAYDGLFNKMDTWLLMGMDVPSWSHKASAMLPKGFFKFLDFVYFRMFAEVGAGIVITTLHYGRRRGVALVGAIMLSYYAALILYYLWPSLGPFYVCLNHGMNLAGTEAHNIQKSLLVSLDSIWQQKSRGLMSFDYFVAFPCMHIVQPLLVMWFLRRWKPFVVVLSLYNCILVASIVLLEWHYVVDLLGGVVVTLFSIWVIERVAPECFHDQSEVGQEVAACRA